MGKTRRRKVHLPPKWHKCTICLQASKLTAGLCDSCREKLFDLAKLKVDLHA